VTRQSLLLFIVCVLAGYIHVRAGFQLIRQEGGAAGRALGVRQGVAAGGRQGPGIQLGLQDFNHFLLLLQLPAEPESQRFNSTLIFLTFMILGAEFAGKPLCQLASLGELLPEALPQVVVNVVAPKKVLKRFYCIFACWVRR